VTRYVLPDLDQLGAELARGAAEVASWLDAVASSVAPAWHAGDQTPETVELARAIARLDLACYQALSGAATRLAAAADAVSACAAAMRAADADVAARACRGSG
jgi:ABC-type branched-subunit amino acid transport system substrate-binding protein